MLRSIKNEWFSNVKGDILAGIVVCMALIPEAIGFSIVAGVDPMVGVYSSFVISVITAIFGGRTGLISAAAGATVLVLASLVQNHGIEYLFAATILTGVIQLILGFFKVGILIKFIPKPVMTGFVNALAILMLQSQLGHFEGGGILYFLGAIGVLVIVFLPKLTKIIPSPIVAIVLITLVVNFAEFDVKTLGDMGEITTALPSFLIPNIPFNMETLNIILPYALSVAVVGIVESLLTAQLVDDLTETKSNKNRECVGQGLGNVFAGFFGGIAGCGMIGQTIVNHSYGGRGRLSTFIAGSSMLLSIILLNEFVTSIPVVALASVMLVVSFKTFSFDSLKKLRKTPKSDTLVMISTVLVVVFTHNLAYGVLVGMLISAVIFVIKMSEIEIHQKKCGSYKVKGQLFFASTTKFINSFDYKPQVDSIDINLENVRIWDESAIDAVDKVVLKFKKNGVQANLIGLSRQCEELLEKLAIHKNKGAKVSLH